MSRPFFLLWLMVLFCGCVATPEPMLPPPTAPAVATQPMAPPLTAVTPTAQPTVVNLLPLITHQAEAEMATSTAEPTATATAEPTPTPLPAARVVIISIDGLRPDAISAELTPNLWALAQTGAYSWAAQTISPSITLPSHTSMLTGVDFAQHGVWWNDDSAERPPITTPSLFTYATAGGLRSLAVYGKTKLRQIALPEVTTESVYALGDVGVSMRFGQLLAVAEEPFDLMVVHLPEVDVTGHATGWMSESYLAAVGQADTAVGVIVQALAEQGLAETSTLIISADHGGQDFTHVDPTLPLNRTIPWIINGPAAVGGGVALASPIETYDTAATALAILGLPLPETLDGQPVWEALR